MTLALTFGEFFTDLWNTEILSWDGLIGLFILAALVAVVK